MANATPLATDYSGVREYIGARYVPVFANPVEWSSTRGYEPLTIVTYQGASYTSTQYVPTGVAIDNGKYWVRTFDFDAQVEAYRRETKKVAEDLAKEVQARTAADNALSTRVTANANNISAQTARLQNLVNRYNYRYVKTIWMNEETGGDDNVQMVVQNNLGLIRLNGTVLTVPEDPTQWIDVVTFEQLGVDFTIGTTVYGAANADFESGKTATMRLKEPSTLPGVFNGLSVRMSGSEPGQRLTVYGVMPVICDVHGLAPLSADEDGIIELTDDNAVITIVG